MGKNGLITPELSNVYLKHIYCLSFEQLELLLKNSEEEFSSIEEDAERISEINSNTKLKYFLLKDSKSCRDQI